MAFKLGNFAVKEIIRGVATDFEDNLLYTLDQLTNATIEVSSDPTEIVDKNGNVVRTIYTSKQATLSATSALLSPALLEAQGNELTEATSDAAIEMPFMTNLIAGGSLDVTAAKTGTLHVMGIFSNGANGFVLTQGTSASVANKTYGLVTAGGTTTITVPAAATDAPDSYLIVYDRDVTSGVKLANYSDLFPSAVKLILYAAVMDPCSEAYKAAYIVAPNSQPDPSLSVSLDSESVESEINYNLNTDYCGTDKVLYYIYFPDEDAVTSVVTA